MDAHMCTIDTPDLPVPAIGIDTGTDVAATSVQNGPYVFVIVIGDANGRWREQFPKMLLSIVSKVSGMLDKVRH